MCMISNHPVSSPQGAYPICPCNALLRSQSLSRCLTPTVGRMQCLTTASKNWLRKGRRVLCGLERMKLQGILVNRHHAAIQQTPETVLWALSGNAVNFFNMAQGIIAALSTLDIAFFAD